MSVQNEPKAPSELTYKYPWGTERPTDRSKRLKKAREKALHDRRRLDDHYAKLTAANGRELAQIEAEIAQLEFLAPGGRYESEREAQLANLVRHLSPDGQLIPMDLPRRGRPKVPVLKRVRKSRAKKL